MFSKGMMFEHTLTPYRGQVICFITGAKKAARDACTFVLRAIEVQPLFLIFGVFRASTKGVFLQPKPTGFGALVGTMATCTGFQDQFATSPVMGNICLDGVYSGDGNHFKKTNTPISLQPVQS